MGNKLESVKCVSLYRDGMFPEFILADYYNEGKVRVYREVKPYYHAQSRTERYKFRKADGKQADFRKFKVEQCVRRKLPLMGTAIDRCNSHSTKNASIDDEQEDQLQDEMYEAWEEYMYRYSRKW